MDVLSYRVGRQREVAVERIVLRPRVEPLERADEPVGESMVEAQGCLQVLDRKSVV